MPRRFWMLPVVLAFVFVSFAVALTSTASFKMRHGRFPNARIVHRNGAMIVESTGFEGQAPPRLKIDKTDDDFGVLPPLSSGVSRFKVRNLGEGPLRLAKGQTSCKCTFAGVPSGGVPPGGEAEIQVLWNSGSAREYRQVAEIKTNDPENPKIDLTITGRVELMAGVAPSEVTLSRLEPDQTHTTEAVAFARHWGDFSLDSLECTIPGAALELERADSEMLSQLKAKSGWKIKLTLPPSAPGRFHGLLRGKMRRIEGQAVGSEGNDEEHSFEIVVAGRVLNRIAVYGKEIIDGDIHLGAVRRSKGTASKLFVKVKDANAELRVTGETVEPAFVRVRLQRPENSMIEGLYELHVEVPPDSPFGSYLGADQARFTLHFDHPRIKSLEMGLRFAVLEKVSL